MRELTTNQMVLLLEAHRNKHTKYKIVGTPDPDNGVLRSYKLIEPLEMQGLWPAGDGHTLTTPLGDKLVEVMQKAIKDYDDY